MRAYSLVIVIVSSYILKFSVVYYFHNSLFNVTHFKFVFFTVVRYINNSLQFLENKIQTRVFLISAFLVKSLMKKLRNSRTSYGINVEVGPLSKLNKRDRLTLKKFHDCNTVVLSILGQLAVIRKLECRYVVRDFS